MTDRTHHVAVIGAGPAGLMAAEHLAGRGVAVTVIERMPSVARKFLMAGRGGLNLTHSEALPQFLSRYGREADARLLKAVESFPPLEIRHWADLLRTPTFIGSSGRVFPEAMKASPLLRMWLQRLKARAVTVRTRTEWRGWDADGALHLVTDDGVETHERFDAVVLAMGGASWPRLGSDGHWVPVLQNAGVTVAPLVPANAGVCIAWSEIMRTRHAGTPLKRIALQIGEFSVRGEAVIARTGLEGGVVYAAGEAIRAALVAGPAVIRLDLKPDLTVNALAERLGEMSAKLSLVNVLRKAKLSAGAIALLHEGTSGKAVVPREPLPLAKRIKAVAVSVTGFSGMDRAISSAGGVAFAGLNDNWMLHQKPGVFVAGEMTDWTAPTGGYLLTACLASGRAAAEGTLAWLAPRDD
jgi:uncharacterized flavoprotein (TIGR03862 family)